MRTIRSFIAVNVGLHAVRAIAAEQDALRRALAGKDVDVRWVAPQNLHITLRFLGQVTEPMVAAIQDGLESILRPIPPFEARAVGLGVFPDDGQPRVVWAGIRDDGALERLHAAISEALARRGLDLDDKPFRSHVTIGRVRGGDGEALLACLAEHGKAPYGVFTVREVACYRSDLRPTGADYKMLWRLPLGGKARTPRPEEVDLAAEPEEIHDEPPADDVQSSDGDETKE